MAKIVVGIDIIINFVISIRNSLKLKLTLLFISNNKIIDTSHVDIEVPRAIPPISKYLVKIIFKITLIITPILVIIKVVFEFFNE